ncbi:hypothetical protein CVT24_012668 [Panaeolus cyanescens]|uniref:CxC2-like cysteine cluster KDZ transposase-associated domain-containing protein n=1 Tax=Panaeolus cyanescens TaxID=181874 RepID=A0A409YKB8_9AGAR|nr:hypothetical protein CVT24_012668 [Panaeolus cyanescens]
MPPKSSTNNGRVYITDLPFLEEDFTSVDVRDVQPARQGRLEGVISAPNQMDVDDKKWKYAKTWSPEDNTEYALDAMDIPWPDETRDADDMETDEGTRSEKGADKEKEQERVKKPRSKISKRPHVVWKERFRSSYLDELCRHAGRGDFRKVEKCPDCVSRKREQPGDAIYRCESCFMGDLVCQDCCLHRHKKQPFHQIEKWTGTHFTSVSLRSMGLRIQLNHINMTCSVPIPCHFNMVVIHTNGIHDIAFDYCGCEKAEMHYIQLLRRRLFPASQHTIQTCATFEVLDLLHKLSLTTKAGTYDLYRGLEKLTDSTGLNTPKSKYRPLMRMSVQYRHLKMLEWGGRAHDCTGPAGTKPGECAVQCPSCARPGINLPDDWDKAPPEHRFLYMLYACMDANFRLKNQIVSNYSQDPGLGTGMAYMLDRKEYEGYVRGQATDDDISTCVGFQAIAQANTRFSQGLRYTGVGGVFCGRSEMILPQGVGNLHKGERYSNMDFIFASAMQDFLALTTILISYDIACQWFKNLYSRMENLWPSRLRVPKRVDLIPAIPKLHEPMHNQTQNHQQYSLNFLRGAGQSDLEVPERVWSGHNAVGNSTKTQGPGTRQDNLDDHFNWWNWLKYITMGATLMRRYRAALADRNLQQEAHKGLTNNLDSKVVEDWEQMCKTWDNTPYPKEGIVNPYASEAFHYTEADARKELALEEEERLKKGGKAVHDTPAHTFVVMALDIERAQRRLKMLVTGNTENTTSRQQSGITEQRIQLSTKIDTWEILVPLYIPGLLQYKADLAKKHGPILQAEHPEDHKIWLPSHLPAEKRKDMCYPGLPEMEEKLRTAECYSALDALRHSLRVKSRLYFQKQKNVRGQRDGTRSRAVIDRVHAKAVMAGKKYRWARAAKLKLSGTGKWEEVLRPLEDRDIRSYREAEYVRPKKGRQGTLEDDQVEVEWEVVPGSETLNFGIEEDRDKRSGTGETRRTFSWIWLMPRKPDAGDKDDEIMRVEWAKSRARSERAAEEVLLLKEEMRRVIVFLGWKSRWWLKRVDSRSLVDKSLKEGLRAIAMKQSTLQSKLQASFKSIWEAPLGEYSPSQLRAMDSNEGDTEVPDGDDSSDDEIEEVNIDVDNEDD